MNTPLLAGKTFFLGGSDFDAADVYDFVVRKTAPDLVLEFVMRGTETQKTLTVPRAALESATGVLKLSQGDWTGLSWLSESKKRDYCAPAEADPQFVPSFLLSRAQHADLTSKGAVELQPVWDFPDLDTFSVVERGTRDVPGLGKGVNVLTLQGKESSTRIVVVDDALFPLVLEREECDGGNVEKISFVEPT